MLPVKESSRGLIVELANQLKSHFAEVTAAWRKKMFTEFEFDGRVMAALERLHLGTGFVWFCQADLGSFSENLRYFGTRLAKLQVDARVVARSLELYRQLCEPYLKAAAEEHRERLSAALEMFTSATYVAVSVAYSDSQKSGSAALFSVLGAELSAPDLDSLLKCVLQITAATFGAQLGVILLREAEGEALRVAASVGFGDHLDPDFSIRPGEGFSGRVALRGEPDLVRDVAACDFELNPILRRNARALWAAPLKKSGGEVIGVLEIGFARPYEWLPTERELLRAIADRSALAIDRARMTDALRQRESRIAELSAHLLRAQEQERKYISHELHDETGQALMVIRLYLGMLESTIRSRGAQARIQETLAVVDRTIEGLRRIIARLSPLVLKELGLVAAIRKEAKDVAKGTGLKIRVAVGDNVGRLPADIETALYRAVQEALHNVAKHAQARNVSLHLAGQDGTVRLLVEDDGVGFVQKAHSRGKSFGLWGMRDRIGALGGRLAVQSSKGRGTRIEIHVPKGVAVPVAPRSVGPAESAWERGAGGGARPS